MRCSPKLSRTALTSLVRTFVNGLLVLLDEEHLLEGSLFSFFLDVFDSSDWWYPRGSTQDSSTRAVAFLEAISTGFKATLGPFLTLLQFLGFVVESRQGCPMSSCRT